jgi:hypothetical protein
MAITAAGPAVFSMGRVVTRVFQVLLHNYGRFLALSALFAGLPSGLVALAQFAILTHAFGAHGGTLDASTLSATTALTTLVSAGDLVLLLVFGSVLQGAVIQASVADLSGRTVSFSDALATGLRYCLPLVGIGLIVGIGCVFASFFFVVPGVLLALAWIVAAPAEVVERVGVFRALGRSLELTRNHRGAILGLALFFFAATWMAQAVLSGVIMSLFGVGFTGIDVARGNAITLSANFQARMLAQAASSVVLTTVLASIGSVGVASIYFELRQGKDGVGIDEIADVFT